MLSLKTLLIPVGLGTLLLGGTVLPGSTHPTHPVVVTAGQEVPHEGALYRNGWNVQNLGDARILDVYQRYQPFLGEPVSPFDGTSQYFRFGFLTYQPANPEGWQVEVGNGGLEDLQLSGYTPQRQAHPHPALRDWLQFQRENGVDTVRLIGPVISEPLCDKKAQSCTQWTMKARFSFPETDLTGERVQRHPVGLWLSHPSVRTSTAQSPAGWFHLNLPSLLAGSSLALLGVLWQLRSSRTGRSVTV